MPAEAASRLQAVGEGLWLVDGPVVRFYGFPFTTRMTVVRLAGGDLWLHSPVPVDGALREALTGLGPVRHLVAPNRLHHLFLADWAASFPDARTWAAPGLVRRRRDLRFDGELGDAPEPAWADELDQCLFRGSPALEEVVFLHRASRTLLVADLVENVPAESLPRWLRPLARAAGILAPEGRMPADWRLSFRFGSREAARASLARILAWEPDNLVLAHGDCVFGDATPFLQRAFDWLG